ncbi:MAG: acyl-CoA thioesterase II [Beijerinckiaceae bacterium]
MSAVSDLIAILDLERLENSRFRGVSPQVGWKRIYGGLVVAQALVAAMRTAPDGYAPHSLHSYFILPGDPAQPIIYETDNLRDGRSFATRRVVARQNGAAIFALSASFHVPEDGFDHQAEMPRVARPETLMSEKQMVEAFRDKLPENITRYFLRDRPIELRPTNFRKYLGAAPTDEEKRHPTQHVWFRATGPLPDDPALHTAFIAYASDMTLLDTAMVAHGKSVFDADIMPASLDHAMWFHRPVRADGWMLYAQDSPSASGALGLARGLIFSEDGTLAASVAQEGLIRRKRPS